MLGQSGELWIWTGAGDDLGIARRHHAPSLPLERLGDYCSPAAPATGADDFVNEVNDVVGEPDRDLLAHPIMVAKWEQASGEKTAPTDAARAVTVAVQVRTRKRDPCPLRIACSAVRVTRGVGHHLMRVCAYDLAIVSLNGSRRIRSSGRTRTPPWPR